MVWLVSVAFGAKDIRRDCRVLPAESMQAEERLALVIGNGAYQQAGATLEDPPRDAELIATSLAQVGFEVTLCADLGREAMASAIKSFGEAVPPDSVALFYYSGHGMQWDGFNWLVPVDAQLERSEDIELAAIRLDGVQRRLEGSGSRLNLLVLDACRNNPWANEGKSVGGKGLAETGSASIGTLVAFATAPGTLAYEGEGDHSPYTRALAEALLVPGRRIEDVFIETRVSVLEETEGRQVPWENGSLTEVFVVLPGEVQTWEGLPGVLEVVSETGGEVVIDGVPRGRLEPFGTLRAELPPGRHHVLVGAQAQVVELRPEQSARLEFLAPSGPLVSLYPSERVPAGEFKGAEGRVVVSRDLQVGRTEVTQDQWEQVMGENPVSTRSTAFGESCRSAGLGPDKPVFCVSWVEAATFANRLSERDGLPPCYRIEGEVVGWPEGTACTGWRLPTEGEWERAARGTGEGAWSGSAVASEVAWTAENAQGAQEVGQLEANGWGLYDLSGNVAEWTWDGYSRDRPVGLDPLGPEEADLRVLRGGGWSGRATQATVQARGRANPEHVDAAVGLRLVRTE